MASGDREANGDSNIHSYLSSAPFDKWISIHPSGWCPPARYKHAAEVFQEKLYVIGGSRNGRYLSDIQVFDLRTLKWSQLRPKTDPDGSKIENFASKEVFPASAGHSVVKWGNQLLVVAGHLKRSSDSVIVWSIDLETQNCNIVKTHGKVPTARGGQSVTVVGSKLLMFGGEDNRRHLLNDLHILNLESMTWDVLEAKGEAPSPRFDHTAAAHADQYLLIFGGSSHSTCFSDLHVLDLQNMEWSQQQILDASVAPRGGQAGTTIDENWYIVGGGDNKSGAIETLVLNMSKLVWSVATGVKERDPLASEGLSLCSTTIDGEQLLIAFGGYNGKYNNEVFILRPKSRNLAQPRLLQSPAAAAAAASVTTAYALKDTIDKKNNFMDVVDTGLKETQVENSAKIVAVETDKISTEKKTLEAKLLDVRAENSRLKGNVDEINNSHTELSLELQSMQNQLAAEISRCSKLEVQIQEMQERLESLTSVEQELELLRRQKSQIDRDMTQAQRQKSGGVWQWVAGGAQSP